MRVGVAAVVCRRDEIFRTDTHGVGRAIDQPLVAVCDDFAEPLFDSFSAPEGQGKLLYPAAAVLALCAAAQIGATSFVGAADAIGVLREASPIVTALLLAGVGGSAVCAELGARTIREEIDAMIVLGLNPLRRLVAPLMVAGVLVAAFLNFVVIFVSIGSAYRKGRCCRRIRGKDGGMAYVNPTGEFKSATFHRSPVGPP